MSFNLKSALCTLAALSFAPNITLAQDCGSADVPCSVADGTYHMTSPDTETPNGIVVHLHGGGGTGKGLLIPASQKQLTNAVMFSLPRTANTPIADSREIGPFAPTP